MPIEPKLLEVLTITEGPIISFVEVICTLCSFASTTSLSTISESAFPFLGKRGLQAVFHKYAASKICLFDLEENFEKGKKASGNTYPSSSSSTSLALFFLPLPKIDGNGWLIDRPCWEDLRGTEVLDV